MVDRDDGHDRPGELVQGVVGVAVDHGKGAFELASDSVLAADVFGAIAYDLGGAGVGAVGIAQSVEDRVDVLFELRTDLVDARPTRAGGQADSRSDGDNGHVGTAAHSHTLLLHLLAPPAEGHDYLLNPTHSSRSRDVGITAPRQSGPPRRDPPPQVRTVHDDGPKRSRS